MLAMPSSPRITYRGPWRSSRRTADLRAIPTRRWQARRMCLVRPRTSMPAKAASRTDGIRPVDFGLMSTHRPSLTGSIGALVDCGLIHDRAWSEATRREYLCTRMRAQKELMFVVLSLLSLALCHQQWLPLLQSSLQELRSCARVCKYGNHVIVFVSVTILCDNCFNRGWSFNNQCCHGLTQL